ncbi:MAG: phosphomethylpyrimidine synthase ThiC, partial [Candidatus Methanoperedens sp.]|nr:phosphomethylpyrimidine synthase ThiC [Candidatus Methanoperedens sp.]
VTKQMEAVARTENIDIDTLISRISEGSIIMMTRGNYSGNNKNTKENNKGNVCVGIGKGLSTKVNVNLGTSTLKINPSEEIKKARIAQMYGADTITDLSMGGDISRIRKLVM